MKRTDKNKRGKRNAQPLFVVRAERSFKRVARKVREEYRKLGLRPAVFK